MTESKSPAAKEVWITGIGIVSSLGEGPDAHWDALNERKINIDDKRFAPYIVHPLAPVSFDAQIPKKGDQRQMEAWQRIGTYAAGLALDSAGVKGNKEILGRMDMVIAAGGGERDIRVDTTILNAQARGNAAPGFLNERLMSDLRPTLFLAQLSNLLAGNIAIVHGVCGTSRTFMGEESAGMDVVRIAHSRIGAGQSDIALVGGSFNGERPDLLMLYEFAELALKNKYAPIWERGNAAAGFALGSLGAFLVIEARDHAEKRGAKPLAKLTTVISDRATRPPGTITQGLEPMLLVAVEYLVTGLTGDPELSAHCRHLLALQKASHKTQTFVHHRTLFPRHRHLRPWLTRAGGVTHVSGTKRHLCLGSLTGARSNLA